MPRKGGSGGNEIFGRKPRLWPVVEELLAFALRDAEAPEGTPPPGLPELLSRRDAALRLASQAETDDADLQFREVFQEFDLDLGEWLSGLPHQLASAKQADEALDLMRRLAAVTDEFDADLDVAELLAEAGLRERTLAEVDRMIQEIPDAWALVRAADALRILGEQGRALGLYRRAEILSAEFEDREPIIERQIPLLEDLGRTEEAAGLREALKELAEAGPYDGEEFAEAEEPSEEEYVPEPAKAQPEPARNAPCPCGSGKKYKRCCGAG